MDLLPPGTPTDFDKTALFRAIYAVSLVGPKVLSLGSFYPPLSDP